MLIALPSAPDTVMSSRRRPPPSECLRTIPSVIDERDRQFLRLLAAFRPHGGLLRAAEICRRVDASIRANAQLRLVWHDDTWWPWFQFDRSGLALDVDCEAVAAELASDLDNWQLANWFAEPNTWLAGRRPVDRLGIDPTAVRAAARADRFVMRG